MLQRIRDLLIGLAAASVAILLVAHFLVAPSGVERAREAIEHSAAATANAPADTPAATIDGSKTTSTDVRVTDITLELSFNGKPLSAYTTVKPRLSLKPAEHDGGWLRPAFQWQDDTAVVLDVPTGRVWFSLRFDANPRNAQDFPGDFIADGWLNINPRQETYTLQARQFLHLKSPVDNNLTQGREVDGCAQATHTSPVRFEWQRISPTDVYEVSIRRVRCKPFDIGPIIYSERQERNGMTLTLDPNRSNDFYMLEIKTFNEHGELTKLQINGGRYTSWEHRFRVE